MSNTPTKDCVIELSSEIAGKGTSDILHVIGPSQVVEGWMSVDGTPGGTLATGGAKVSVNGTEVTDPNFEGGTNVTLQVAGSDVTINATGAQGPPGTSQLPYVDIQAYGSTPHAFVFNRPTASATTVSGSPNVTISSGTLATALKNGQGVTIWAAGASTSQSTPSAPTITSDVITGAQTLTYACVGYDSKGGLTAASSSGTVTNAPTIFGSLPVAISSISVTSNVCSVVLASPLNNTVSAGMTLHITNVTVKTELNGIWTIASAADTTHVTFAITTSDGSGTVSASSLGRVSNTQIISAISRAANGTITITTAQNHNFQVGGTLNPTVILIEFCTPDSLNGYYIISSASGTSITCLSGVLSAVTGSVTAGASTTTVWEYTTVACPALSGTTKGYYIYSDSPGGSLSLIGRTVLGESHFVDWGPSIAAGYTAPGYVPTSAPVAAQAQMLTTTIASGGGTTSLVLNANAGQSISALGATIMYDDAPNMTAALAAVTQTNSSNIAGAVLLSAQITNLASAGYIFNSPVFVPNGVNVIIETECIVNDTISFGGQNRITSQFGTARASQNYQFATQNFVDVQGIGNPMFLFGASANQGASWVDGVGFTNNTNGVCALQIQSVFYCHVSNSLFKSSATNQGNNIGIIVNGGCSSLRFDTLNWKYTNRFYNSSNSGIGQSTWGPPIGAIWIRASDNASIPNNADISNLITFTGNSTALGRGILFDATYCSGAGSNPTVANVIVGDSLWLQAGTTPIIMCMGQAFQGIDIMNVTNDTSNTAIIANLATSYCRDVTLKNCVMGAGYSAAGGSFITNLSSSNNSAQFMTQLQRMAIGSVTSTTAGADTCSVPNCTTGSYCSLAAGNASATLDLASGNAYIASVGTGSVVINHSNTSGMIFIVTATIGND